MKGLLIFIGLLLAAGIYILSNFGAVSAPLIARIVVPEGTVDAEQNAAQAMQPDAFTAKYQTFLDQRYRLSRVAVILDDDTFLAETADTHDRYAGTPLQNDPEYGYMIFHRAELLNGRNQYAAAAALYLEYLQLFPQGSDSGTAKSAITGLRINHGLN